MKWTAIWAEKAVRQLSKLPKTDARRILLKTDDVEADPFAHLERLASSSLYKFRVGRYRIIVSAVNRKLVLHIVMVKKRSRVYS